jgi:hypothetical protein
MWLFTDLGFYSVVADTTDPTGQRLLVRARCREDIERLLAWARERQYPLAGVSHTPTHDYPWRTRADRKILGLVAWELVAAIDYPNFKGRVHQTEPSPERASAYMRVWEAMRGLQTARERLGREALGLPRDARRWLTERLTAPLWSPQVPPD